MYRVMRRWYDHGRIRMDVYNEKTEICCEISFRYTDDLKEKLEKFYPLGKEMPDAAFIFLLKLNILIGGFDND